MKSHDKQMPVIGIFLGLALMVAAAFFAVRHLIPGIGVLILILSGYVICLVGCASLGKAKGYTASQGMLVGMIFPLLVLIMPDRTKMSKAERDQAEREEAGDQKASRNAKRRPLKGSKKVGAWLFGFFLFALGVAIVAGYEIYRSRVIVPESKGMAAAISVNADKLDPQNDGKLIHVTGALAGVENLTDPEFGVAVDALRLRRRVWMYQWQQGSLQSQSSYGTEDSKGNSTTYLKTRTYNYSKNWLEQLIDSRSFYNAGHDNPATMEIAARAVDAIKITLGVFAVTPELVGQIDNFEAVPLSDKNLSALAEPIRAKSKLFDGGIYVGANADQPAIGDLKIKFESAPAAIVSVIAKQDGNNLSPYAIGKSGAIAQLRVGTFSVQEMTSQFSKDELQRRVLVWMFGGFIILFGGIVIAVARRR
jgi:transmembrane protein TMEM43